MAAHPVIQPFQTALFEMFIERGEARRDRNRHQEVAPGIADQALNPGLRRGRLLPLSLPLPGRPKRSRNR
jgi:hypothetical protein